jgi:hypothetical protein
VKTWDINWAWWFIPVIPALGRLRWEDHKFETSLDYRVRSCVKNNKRPPEKTKQKHTV